MNNSIYTKEYKCFTEKLKEARKEMGIDQKKTAKLLGKTQSYVSKVESGQIRVDIIQLKKFAEIYKKNLDFFIK